jgi:hypothetical protein
MNAFSFFDHLKVQHRENSPQRRMKILAFSLSLSVLNESQTEILVYNSKMIVSLDKKKLSTAMNE